MTTNLTNVPITQGSLKNLSNVPTTKGKTTLILGDSIDKALIASLLAKGDNTCINLSGGGYRVNEINRVVDDLPQTHNDLIKVDQIILSIGVNDIRYCHGRVQHLKISFTNLIDKLKLLYSGVKIFIRCILPTKIQNQFTVINIIKMNRLLLHLCRTKRCYFIDLFKSFLNADGIYRDESLYRDNVHLKQRGTSIIAKKYISIINDNKFNPFV